jgi:plasmid stabilization system protein ParE
LSTVRLRTSAVNDLSNSIIIIREYFASRELYEYVDSQIEKFLDEFTQKKDMLQVNPRMYRVRSEGLFVKLKFEIRSFQVHWFTVFYICDEKSDVEIWHIRPSKSDFTKVVRDITSS